MVASDEYRLLDCGHGRRLEAFGGLVVDRAAPTADRSRRTPGSWADAISYRAGRGWATAGGDRPAQESVRFEIEGVAMTARLGQGGQVGVFPEHAMNAAWLRAAIAARTPGGPQGSPEVLNLFAHTGLFTLIAAAAGARVTHVDASRPAVGTARANAGESGLETRPVRWIVDDAAAFVRREGRRGRRYAGIIADPPSYGHGARGDHGPGWQFETGIDDLLHACRAIAEPDAFWLLSTHTPGWDADRLAATLEHHAAVTGTRAEGVELRINAESGAVLNLGAAARLDPRRRDWR